MLAARSVKEEADADDRVVEAAAADFVLDVPTPDQRIPLEQVDQKARERVRLDPDRIQIDEAAAEAGALCGRERVDDAVEVGRLDDSFGRVASARRAGGEDDVIDIS